MLGGQRAGMFHVPHQQPVGDARLAMGGTEYARRAGPAIEDGYSREAAIQKSFEDAYQGPKAMAGHGMRALMQDGPPASGAGGQPRSPPPRSRGILDDGLAHHLVDGRGDGGADYAKAPMPMGRQPFQQQQAPQRRHVPSSAILGTDPNHNWVVDRDQQNLHLGSDPAVLWNAAHLGEANKVTHDANKQRARVSTLAFGDYELNPGGHRLNAHAARADDFGIGRLRSDLNEGGGQVGKVAEMNYLMSHDPRATDMEPKRYNPYAGKSACSNQISFGMNGALDPPKENPHAGRRAQASVFGANSGPSGPTVPAAPGCYVGFDDIAGPAVKQNPHASKSSCSTQMEGHLWQDPRGAAAQANARHHQRRSVMPPASRRVPAVEQVVFHSDLTAQDPNSQPALLHESHEGKRSVNSGLMPEEALRAARTNVGPQELGGDAGPAPHGGPPPAARAPRGGYADHADLLHYTERRDGVHGGGPLPPRVESEVARAMEHGMVPPSAYSEEPRGLPRRHPGAERLRRGRGVDGEGRDHHGRQLATSLVDEAVFGRSPMKGQIAMQNNGANFGINQAGEFAHR